MIFFPPHQVNRSENLLSSRAEADRAASAAGADTIIQEDLDL